MADRSAVQQVAAEVRAELARQYKPQRFVMDVLDLSQPAVSARLQGKHPFDVAELARLADALGVPLVRFLGVEQVGAA